MGNEEKRRQVDLMEQSYLERINEFRKLKKFNNCKNRMRILHSILLRDRLIALSSIEDLN